MVKLMSIRSKILIACLSLTAVTLAFGMITRTAQTRLGTMAVSLYDEAFMSMSYLRSAQNTLMTISRDAALGGAADEETSDRLENAIGDISVSQERAMSQQSREIATALSERLTQISEVFKQSGRLPDRAAFAELENRFNTAVEINAGDGFRSRQSATKLVLQLSRQTWTAMSVSIAVAVAITLLLSRAIVPAMNHAVGIATAIASGRLDNHIVTRGKSETSVLLRALAAMQRSIAEKIARIEHLMAAQANHHATEMASQHVRFETALDNMVQGLCMVDDSGRVIVHNRRFAELFAAAGPGTPVASALPEPLVVQPDTTARASRSFIRTLDDERIISVTEQSMHGGGWVATYEDITERHRIEARMTFMTRHDSLTGLPNRVLYREQMEHALALARRGQSLAVLCLDLDHFKAVNDTLGHSVGDSLLHAVAQRLLAETRETDMVVRLGGDEFAIIQSFATQPVDAKILAERLVLAIGKPFIIGDHTLSIGTSVGIAIASDGLMTAETLLKGADLALYRAKADGRGTFRFFEAEMDERMQARRQMELDLRRAVAERQFENYYQPLVAVATHRIDGFEALVRWQHPTRGMVSPGEFIPIAEDTGLITQIGSQVLERACFDAQTWPEHVKVAVNLSPLQFRNRHLAKEVAETLGRSGLKASRLELEITESIVLQESETILAILTEIRELGVRISMDDFGTGYSSLSYLRRFPFDKIKIDQSFIRHLSDSADCTAIVRAVLGLGRSLGMRVIAEGVETEEQLAILQAEGCEQVQGYLFSKPRPFDTLAELLQQRVEEAA